MMRHLFLVLALIGTASAQAQNVDSVPSPQVPGERDAGAEATQDDPFELDPSVAFEAFFAGNHARAFDLAVTFAGRGDPPSMRLLGQMYANGLGVDADQSEAALWFRLAAEAGEIEARVLLATMLLDGAFIERNELEAASLLTASANDGHVQAKQMLGMLHLEGRGVDRDLIRGAELIREAAEDGDITAIYTLGILYSEGAGVRQDTSEAYQWYERAARRGNPEAQIELALGILRGDAGDPDLTEERRIEDGIFWLRRAAEAGNPVAENRLAHAYRQGYGVPLDPIEAAFFHGRAVAGGLPDARLDAFVTSLSEDQQEEARERLAQYRASPNPFDQDQ